MSGIRALKRDRFQCVKGVARPSKHVPMAKLVWKVRNSKLLGRFWVDRICRFMLRWDLTVACAMLGGAVGPSIFMGRTAHPVCGTGESRIFSTVWTRLLFVGRGGTQWVPALLWGGTARPAWVLQC